MTTFTEMFRNPTPEVTETVAQEIAAGLEELELAARGLIDIRGEQPESTIHSDPGALRGDVPLSRTSESEDKNG